MTRLTLLYDARCGLCCAMRDWIGRQRQLIPVDCQPKPDAQEDLIVRRIPARCGLATAPG